MSDPFFSGRYLASKSGTKVAPPEDPRSLQLARSRNAMEKPENIRKNLIKINALGVALIKLPSVNGIRVVVLGVGWVSELDNGQCGTGFPLWGLIKVFIFAFR